MMTLVAAGYGVCLAPAARIEGLVPLALSSVPCKREH
jgi:hypothetical protein